MCAAHKGNTYAIGNKGKPKKWTDVEEMIKAIDKWFKWCADNNKPLTVTGLAIALDFTSRLALLNYEKKVGYEEYFYSIKKAKLIVQNFSEEYLYSGKHVAGAIFSLKENYKWKDRIDFTSKGEHIRQPGIHEIDEQLKKLEEKTSGADTSKED